MNLLKQNILVTFLFSFVLFFSSTVMAEILITHDGDSIFYDESNNHYVITYVGLQGEINEVIWHPATDINVEVEEEYKALKNGKIKYEYKIEVNETSKLDLNSFHFYALAVDKASIKVPEKWRSHVRNTYELNDPEQRIGWSSSRMPVQAGKTIEGFEITSMALPIYRAAYVSGKTEILAYVDYGPNADVQYYFNEEIIGKNFEGKAVITAVPSIPVSVPFNPLETYTAFHQSLLDYIKKGFVDASIVTNISDTSTVVLTALKANDVNSALSNLKKIRMLVEGKNDKPLVLKELRKILIFNIKFINTKLNS